MKTWRLSWTQQQHDKTAQNVFHTWHLQQQTVLHGQHQVTVKNIMSLLYLFWLKDTKRPFLPYEFCRYEGLCRNKNEEDR